MPWDTRAQEILYKAALAAVPVLRLLKVRAVCRVIRGRFCMKMQFTTKNPNVCTRLRNALQALLTHVANGADNVTPPTAPGGVGAFPSNFYAAVQETILQASGTRGWFPIPK